MKIEYQTISERLRSLSSSAIVRYFVHFMLSFSPDFDGGVY